MGSSTNEGSLNIKLRKGGTLSVDFEPLMNAPVTENVVGLEKEVELVEVVNDSTRLRALRIVFSATKADNEGVAPQNAFYFIVDLEFLLLEEASVVLIGLE